MRLFVRSALVAVASLVTVSAAHAAAGLENRSSGTAPLSWETRTPIKGPKSGKLGGSLVQLQVSADLDPLADPSKPLLAVDMPEGVVVQASWSDAHSIDLTVVDAGSETGTFKVQHTLAPHVTLFITAFGYTLTYDYAATTLINHVPGSKWSYLGQGQTTFEPWGFAGAVVNVTAPPLADAQLFSIPLSSLTGGTPLTGQLALNATTSPTFGYETTSVVLDQGDPLGGANRTWRIPTTDADFLEVTADVAGEIGYVGSLFVRPSVTVTKIGKVTLPFPISVEIGAAGVELPYASDRETAIPVVFPKATFHIPLPNVKAQPSLDLGEVAVGATASDKADVVNTGEMNAAFTFESSDPQFEVVSGKQVGPAKDTFELKVSFTPSGEGPQSAEITVTSNDPNEPVQFIKVTGTGTTTTTSAPVGDLPEEGDDLATAGPMDSGCGCRTAPTSSGGAGLAVFGLAVAALLRRRRAVR
jgi:MYXO-CTERM domain-containing protein